MRSIFYKLSIGCMLMAASCASPKKTVYFAENGPQNPSVLVENIERRKETTLLPDDIVAIKISTISSILDKEGLNPAPIFNQGGTAYSITPTAGSGAASGAQNLGYLIDQSGYIDYPVIGKIKVSGLTLRQLKELLADKLKAYVKDPVVEANIINFRVTVDGEVGHPGFVVAPNQKLSVLDALASVGGIPISGRKDNILVVRETEGKREYARLNLNSRTVFSSPYFYLKQNDYIYVEPSRIRKQEGNDFMRVYLPIFSTLLSTALAVYGITQLSK